MSPKSYANSPRVRLGQAAGSTAITRTSEPPRSFWPMNGNTRPEKFEPPPVQPISTSGYASARSIWAIASSPITVWCRRTWLSTEPSAYFVSSRCAACSTASEIAIPRLPVESGCSARIARPDAVSSDGLGTQRAPNASISARRYGFWSYETRTM